MMECFDLVTESIKTISSKEAIPVVLGGDHSISVPVVRALTDSQLHVAHFDSHPDMMDDFMCRKYTHRNLLKWISELDHEPE